MRSADILIADDHELFRRTVRSFIEAAGRYRVCGEAGDGIEAVEKARHLRPDIVLMDINMPRMGGLEAARIIRREMPDCHVIIVTQNHPTIAREQARSVGAKGSVTKSDLTRDLLPTIEKVFENSQPDSQQETESEATASENWVHDGGALGKLVRQFDWSKTPLGPIEQWPQSLETIVRVMLTSRFAMWMSWGPDLTFLYNDAYAKMTLGKKHPWALGKPSEKVWEEIWDDIGPRIRKVIETGEATWDEALLLFLERSGYREETYHTFSYSPLSQDDGKIAGHLCVVTEETDRIIGDRRLKTLRSLAAELSKTITEEDVVASVSLILGDNQQDLPFTLTYLLSADGTQAKLTCCTGLEWGHPAAPTVIELAEKDSLGSPIQNWPIQDLLNGKDSVLVEDLAERYDSLPSGTWDRPPVRALLLPIASQAQGPPAGVFVAGLNSYRPLDVSYAGFLNLVAGQIAASVANARAYEMEKTRAEGLAEIDRAKTLFFSNVSHEFRTPLTLMLAPLEDMLSESNGLDPRQYERLDIAHRNSLRLLKLVNTLLDFSRIEAGRFEASYESTDLCQLTSELASVFRSAIERAGLRFIVNCAKFEEPVYVDPELWEKIVFNLLSNAFKFTFKGEIEVLVRRLDSDVELVVRDTGTGIPAEDLPHLFERFYRVNNAQGRTFEGSGIGLAIVKEFAKQHGGTVRVESELDRGSTFTVTIPLGKDHLPAERIGAQRTLASTALRGEAYVEEALHWLPEVENAQMFPSVGTLLPSDDLRLQSAEGRSRILLADDNADMREYVRKLLSPFCDVETVADGQAALDAVREHPPDLVLTDVMMPKLDGFGLLKELRSDERTATVPVIMLSARAGEESRIEGLRSGADDYLIKPFSARELLARVTSHVKMARIRREAAQAERTLRERDSRLRAAFSQTYSFLVLLETDGTVIEANRAAVEAAAGSRDELLGRKFWEGSWWAPLPEEVAPLKDAIAKAASGQPVREECCFCLPDGSRRFVDRTCSPVLDENGNVIMVVATGLDITKRKLAEQALRESEQRYRAITEASPIMVWMSGLDRLCYYFNKGWLDFVGRTLEEESGDGWTENVHPDDFDRCLQIYVSNFDARRPFEMQYRLKHHSGQYRWILDRGVPRYTPDGIFEGYVGGCLDIHDQREAEEKVRRADISFQLMKGQDEERRHIARELHDSAGQTLTVLGISLAQLAQKVGRNAPDIATEIENIQDTVQQLHREIRTTSYLLHPPLLDESGLYSAVSWYVDGLLERSGLKVRLDIAEDFGRLPSDLELVIFRLVQECLTNIHRHAESKTASIRILREPNQIALDIRDQGKGMSAARLAEVQGGRTGVGIRGMRERLRQFEGKMSIESDSSGTRIFVTVPTPKAESPEDQSKAEPLQAV